MLAPFPGMDPYLEHPVLWESVHARLITAMANQMQPRLDPRYVASVEERIYIEEGASKRIPDDWIQDRFVAVDSPPSAGVAIAEPETDVGVEIDVQELEIHQKRVEILDVYNGMKLVAVLELLSPTNKATGEGRTSYLAKQKEILGRQCHLVEIDLLQTGPHVLAVPAIVADQEGSFDYLVCVSPQIDRRHFTLYPKKLRERLPRIKVPLAEIDSFVPLDVQAALEQVYHEGRYMWRVRYQDPCDPALNKDDQNWAWEQWRVFQERHPNFFPMASNP